RTMGAATRALDISLAFAKERVQFGEPIVAFQAVEFMLADMAAQIMAARSMLYRVGWQAARGGTDRKELHALASAVKLVWSETAGRCADRPRPEPRGPRLHARAAGRTPVARAPGRPHLGGHLRDPADDHRQRAPQARPRGLYGMAVLTHTPAERSPGSAAPPACRRSHHRSKEDPWA